MHDLGAHSLAAMNVGFLAVLIWSSYIYTLKIAQASVCMLYYVFHELYIHVVFIVANLQNV